MMVIIEKGGEKKFRSKSNHSRKKQPIVFDRNQRSLQRYRMIINIFITITAIVCDGFLTLSNSQRAKQIDYYYCKNEKRSHNHHHHYH